MNITRSRRKVSLFALTSAITMLFAFGATSAFADDYDAGNGGGGDSVSWDSGGGDSGGGYWGDFN